MLRRPPRSTLTDTLFPYTTLFRSLVDVAAGISSTLSNFNVDRETRFGFAEISLPILSPANNISFAERLILTGAVRYESIDRVGNVATPKFGIILAPASDIAFKFSWGKSFKDRKNVV